MQLQSVNRNEHYHLWVTLCLFQVQKNVFIVENFKNKEK